MQVNYQSFEEEEDCLQVNYQSFEEEVCWQINYQCLEEEEVCLQEGLLAGKLTVLRSRRFAGR